jgi:hypothetical protein
MRYDGHDCFGLQEQHSVSGPAEPLQFLKRCSVGRINQENA